MKGKATKAQTGKKRLVKVPQEKTKKTTTETLRKPRGIKIQPMPDFVAKHSLRSVMESPPKTTLDRSHYQPLAQLLPDGLTDEQRAVKDAGDLAKVLLQKEDWVNLVESMRCLRQGYAIVYRRLQELCAKLHEEYESRQQPMPNIEDFLVHYAMYEASKPFTEHQWMTSLMNVVLPHMADIIDKHTEQDAKEEIEALSDANEKRKSRPVPIGFKHTPEQELAALTRDRSLVLVGWYPAVKWLIDQLVNHVVEAKDDQTYMIVRFKQRDVAVADQQARLISIGVQHWRGCGNNDRALAMCMGEHAYDKISQPPDLLVCDNLGMAYTGTLTWRPLAASAGDAHRRFRKWCDAGGAAFVGGLPQPSKETPDITAPEYEQLRTFTHLRPVRVEEVDDKYRLTVGHAAAVFDVDKATLDNFGGSSILIVPGDKILQ